jgi:hypothetical protein
MMVAFSAPAKIKVEEYAMRAPPPPTAAAPINILVLENRSEVLSGDKRESFEGVTRELYGIPIARNTPDNQPMSAYLGERIRLGFQSSGWTATFLPTAKGAESARAVQALDLPQGAVALAVDLHEWNYDFGGFTPEQQYDVTLSLYDSQKRLLATRDFKGVDPMPTGGWKHFKRRYSELYQALFDRFFADADIAAALQGRAAAITTAAPATATVEDRLRALKDLLGQGLIDQATYEQEQKRIVSEL